MNLQSATDRSRYPISYGPQPHHPHQHSRTLNHGSQSPRHATSNVQNGTPLNPRIPIHNPVPSPIHPTQSIPYLQYSIPILVYSLLPIPLPWQLLITAHALHMGHPGPLRCFPLVARPRSLVSTLHSAGCRRLRNVI
jgi:hypothetical protein